METGVLVGLFLVTAGLTTLGGAVWWWEQADFGRLNPSVAMRQVIPGVVLSVLGVQTIFSSFFLSILGLGRKGRGDVPADRAA
jgi:hypothetical protein